uniref:CCHC-type domain-containing protein n=1 Tax=Tanacetum cinerariifolium TaxID=118510 RepID=A0A699H535_TANCI|nr:hypothetical protein [Tanacetum cinerariifolium]
MDPRQLVVVLGLNVVEIEIAGEIGMLEEIRNLWEFMENLRTISGGSDGSEHKNAKGCGSCAVGWHFPRALEPWRRTPKALRVNFKTDMSSASSAVTYTSVYTDSEPGRVFWEADEELSDGEPIYPEYIPLEDEHILSAREQPLPPIVSPTAESPGYVAESDPKEDPEEYEEDETEDGPVDYPIDGGDDGDDDDGDSSGYDVDDKDEDEEEEHLAPADSAVVIPIDELASPPEGTEPIIPPPSTDTATTGATDFYIPSTKGRGERLDRCMTPAALPSPPLPPSLYPPPPVDRKDDIPESEQPPRKRFADTVEAEIRHRGIGEVGYEIRDTWIDPAEADLYALLEDAQDGRTRISQRVAMDSQRVDLLIRDRMTLEETVWIVEEEAYVARETWAQSLGQIMAPVTRQGHNPPPPNTDTPPHHMTLESVQAMIDQALLRNSTNGDGSQSSYEDNPRHVQTTRLCFYVDFMKCHPLNFKGNEGVNSQIRTLGPEAYAMTWELLKKKMTDKYCPQGELKKLDIELWNLKFVANENEKIDKYISGLPDNIYGNVKSSKPRTLNETIELTNDLMDQKLRTYTERADNKRKADDTSRNNHGHQQQPFKKQNVAKVYNMGTGERKPYEGSLPKCTKCQRHHNGPCTRKCHKCNKVGHFARDCRSSGNANVANAQRDGERIPRKRQNRINPDKNKKRGEAGKSQKQLQWIKQEKLKKM